MGEQAITLRQGNDERVQLTVTPAAGDSLDTVTGLEFLLKPDRCTEDSDPAVLRLSSVDPTQLEITGQTADQITAVAKVPAASLAEPYTRWWRLDVLVSTARRSAIWGPAEVIDL